MRQQSSFSKRNLIVFALVFSLIGSYLIYRSFAAPNPNLPGDLNNDNVVSVVDLSILLSNFGTMSAAADINSSGAVNITDLSVLLSNYNRRSSPPVSAKTALVSVTGGGFVPSTISIARGDQIVWTNTDSSAHQVAADPHPAHGSITDFDSSVSLQPGDSLGFFFEQVGTFYLHDEFNTTHRLTVIVK
jgi:plastocyanin